MEDFAVFVIIVMVFGVILVFMRVKAVPQGMNFTVERFGKYTKTLHPGLNIIVPLFDRVGRKLNMMETVIDVPTQEVITRDNAMVSVDGVVFYQVLDAARAAYEVNNLHNATGLESSPRKPSAAPTAWSDAMSSGVAEQEAKHGG